MLLLAHELLLLGIDPERGTGTTTSRERLGVALAGCLVAELAVDGFVDVSAARLTAGTPPVGAHPLLAEAALALQERPSRRSTAQLRRLDRALGGVRRRLVEDLVERGVLGRRRDILLGIFPVTRHPVRDLLVHEEVLGRLRLAAGGDGPLDPRTAVLLALAGPAGLLEVASPLRAGRRHARDRMRTALGLVPVAAIVRRVIAQIEAEAAGGALAATTAATFSL